MIEPSDATHFRNGYADVNGLRMYYEIYGEGKPLVLIHGGGSTIQTTFGRILPHLAKHRQVIGVELQAHGRTNDRKRELSFEQDADDVAALLKFLDITKADIFGFSNGGTTTIQLAVRHPELVDRIIIGSAFAKRSGAPSGFWDFMKNATLQDMPQPYIDAYRKIAPHPDQLQIMHDKCAKRMVDFRDIPDEQLQSIKSHTLIIAGDADVVTPEHAVEMSRLIPSGTLAIVPGGHGSYLGEITSIDSNFMDTDMILPIIEKFLADAGKPEL